MSRRKPAQFSGIDKKDQEHQEVNLVTQDQSQDMLDPAGAQFHLARRTWTMDTGQEVPQDLQVADFSQPLYPAEQNR